MVTRRGTGRRLRPCRLPPSLQTSEGARTTLSSFCFTEATDPPKLPRQRQRPGAVTAPHGRLRSKQSGLTIPSSAASEASPLQRVVRPTVGEEPSQPVKMRRPSWPKWLSSPRCTDQGVEAWRCRAASPDLPHVGLRDLAEEDRLRVGRTVHHGEPRAPDWGRDIATRRDEPQFGSGDFAEEAADIERWRRAR